MTTKQKETMVDLVAAALGGFAGAIATRLLEHVGVKRTVAAAGVTAAGTVAAVFTDGAVRAAAGGAAAAGAGQLVAVWFEVLDRRLSARNSAAEEETDEVAADLRNGYSVDEAIERAFQRALRRLHRDAADDAVAADGSEDDPDGGDSDDGPLVIKEPIGAYRAAS